MLKTTQSILTSSTLWADVLSDLLTMQSAAVKDACRELRERVLAELRQHAALPDMSGNDAGKRYPLYGTLRTYTGYLGSASWVDILDANNKGISARHWQEAHKAAGKTPTAEAVAPEAVAPEAVAPEAVAPEAVAPEAPCTNPVTVATQRADEAIRAAENSMLRADLDAAEAEIARLTAEIARLTAENSMLRSEVITNKASKPRKPRLAHAA